MDPNQPVFSRDGALPEGLIRDTSGVQQRGTGVANDLLPAKYAEVKAAGLAKRAELAGVSPADQLRAEFQRDQQTMSLGQLARTYGNDVAASVNQERSARDQLLNEANRSRTGNELTKDTGLSLLSGGVNLVGGGVVLGEDLLHRAGSAMLTFPAMGLHATGVIDDGLFNKVADDTNAGRAALLGPQQRLLGQFNQWRDQTASTVKQADQTLMGEENAAAAEQHKADYERAVANGEDPNVAAAARVAKDYGHDFGNVFSHPTTLLDTAVEQVPTFGIGAVAKGAITAEQVAAGVAKQVAKETTAAGALKAMGAEGVRKVEESLAHANTRALVTATEMGSNYGQAAGDIATAPIDELAKRFPDVQRQLDAGVPEDQVRAQLASDNGLITAAVTAPIAYGSSYLSQDFLAHPTGKGLATTLKAAGKNVAELAGEVGEESLQGAGGQLAQNIANQQTGDVTANDLLDGVGGAAGQGGAAALGAAGAFRAPGLAVGGAVLTGKAALTAAKVAGKPVLDALAARGEKVKAENAASVDEQKAAVASGLAEDASTLSKGFENQKAPNADGVVPENVSPAAEVATAPAEADPILTPAAKQALNEGVDQTVPLNKVTALAQAVNLLGSGKPMDAETGATLQLFALKAARELRQHVDTITDPAMKQAANNLLENDGIRNLEEAVKNQDPAFIQSLLDQVPEDAIPAGTEPTPEVKAALAQLSEVAAVAPEKLSSEQAARVLFHSEGLTPQEVNQVKLAESLAKVREDHLARAEELAKQYPQIKSPDIVSSEIANDGFQLGNKRLPSLNDMARNVVQAINNGHTQVAVQAMADLANFAQSRIDRAMAFDQAARQHVENGSAKGQGVEVQNTRQLKTDSSLGTKANVVDITSPGSRGLVDIVHNDAQTAAGIYNTLAQANPSLVQAAAGNAEPLPSSLTAPKEASYKSMTKGDGVAIPGFAPAATQPKTELAPKSSTVTALEAKVAAASDFAANLPADATITQVEDHIATMKRIEAVAGANHGDLVTSASDARAQLEKILATDMKNRAAGADGKLVDNTTDRRQATEQRAAIDNLPPAESRQAKLEARIAQLEQEQRTSEVTGLRNKKAFEEDTALGWSTVGAADMDGLKKLNDHVGHAAADVVLKALGEMLKGYESDTVRFYHRSGDEFAARFKNTDEAAKIMADVQAKLDAAQVSFEVDGKPFIYNGIGFSVGHGATYEAADTAVNADKQSRLDAGKRESPRESGAPRRLQSAAPAGEGQQRQGDVPKSVSERFAGPAQTLGEISADASPAERYLRTNKFFSAFKLNSKATGLFARVAGGLETVASALIKAEKDPLALREVYAEQHQYMPIDAQQVGAMREIIGQFVPQIVDTLNQSLYNAAVGLNPDGSKRVQTNTKQAAKGFLQDLLDPAKYDKAIWQYGNRLSLHVAEWGVGEDGKPYIRYQPEVAQAMALAVLNWGLATVNNPTKADQAKVLEMFPNGVPEAVQKAFDTSHYAVQPINTMAADLVRILGLSSNSNSSVLYTDGLPKALIHDALNALAQTGAITLNNVEGTEKTADGRAKTLPFIAFNKSGDTNNWSTDSARNLKSLRDALGNQALMTYLLTPDAQDRPTFGEPSKQVPTRQSGTGQKLSDTQRKSIKNENNVPFHANTELLVFQDQLGDDNLLSLLGYSDPADALNEQHRRQVEGVNQGLTNALSNLREIFALWQGKAEEAGKNMQDVPAFYSHRIVSNGRTMANGFGPQSDKIARELISAVRENLDLKNNEDHKLAYAVTLAQALGIKTEKVKNAAAAVQIQQELAHPAFKQLFADMAQLNALDGQDQADLANSITRQIAALQKGVDGTRPIPATARAIHALFTHARLLAHPDPSKFETHLAVELDGKTDGPINAIVHFGLHTANLDKQIDQLRKGGWFLNESDPKVLADLGAKAADLYTDTAEGLQRAVNNALAKKTGTDHQMLSAALHLLQRVGHVTLADDGSVQVTRNMPKGGLVSMNYGAGEQSVNRAIAYDILDYVHEQMSKSLRDNVPLDGNLQKALRLMTGRYLDKDGVWQKTDPVNVDDMAGYAKGPFSQKHIAQMVQNLRQTAGGMLTDVIQSEMDPVMSTYTLLYQASALQTAQLRKAYNEAYAAKQAERVAAGELGPKEPLGKGDEQAILADLAHLVPAYASLVAGGAKEEQGVNVSTKDHSGQYLVDGQALGVGSIFGGSRSDINTTQITNPGVRAAPLLTIAAGDATMMTLLGRQNPKGTLNVYDGWEVPASELKDRAVEANKAVYDGWQFDLLGSVANAFGNFNMDISSLNAAELQDLGNALRIPGTKEMPHADLVDAINQSVEYTRSELAQRAAATEVNKAILRELASSNDHMSTGEKPYQNEGKVVENLSAYIAEQQVRARTEPAAAEVTVSAEPAPAKNVSEALANLAQGGLKTLGARDVKSLIENQGLQGKVRQFVYNQIAHLFPADLQVHVGSEAEIAQKQNALFPGVDFGGKNNVGATYENHVFIKNGSEETLVHELVHAATYGLLQRFYDGGMKGLTAHQRDAVRQLEAMSREFVAMPRGENESVQQAQSVIRGLLNEGATAAAVNEFMAWTMSNHQIQDALAKVGPLETVKALAKKVLEVVRKALGLPKNEPIDSFLTQAMGQVHRLARRPALDPMNVTGLALFQTLPNENQAQADRLSALSDQLEWLRSNLPTDGLSKPETALKAADALVAANEIRERFVDAGFQFNEQQQYVFEQMQALMSSTIQLDSAVMEKLQHLYDEVMPQLSAEDFLANPNDTSAIAHSEAVSRFNALQGVGNLTTDAAGRSNLLANFVALALVYEPLREKLATLAPAKAAIDKSSIDARIRSATSAAFDVLTGMATNTARATNQQTVLDNLVNRLAVNQAAAIKRANAPASVMEKAEAKVKERMAVLGQRADDKLTARLDAGQVGGIDGWINGALNAVRGITSKDGSAAFGESLLSFANESKLPRAINQLIGELVGRTASNEHVIELLDKSKSMVARVRQRLREEAPAQVRALFTEPVSKQDWATLHKVVGKADMAALLGNYSRTQLKDMLSNPASLQSAIAAIESKFTKHADEYIQAAKDLGHYMVTGNNRAKGLLYSNAHAMAHLLGTNHGVTDELASFMGPLLDRLTSLRAMEALSQGERDVAANLMATQGEGMEKLLRLMKTLANNEWSKAGANEQLFNAKKGYVPESLDPRSKLILASSAKAAELVKMGYRKVGDYHGDVHDANARDMAYYAIKHIGGQASYRQGAMQTVEGTVSGVDQFTGRALGVALQTMIGHQQTVAKITADKLAGNSVGTRNLVPIFGSDGKVVAYQRTLDPSMLDAHLRGSRDLPQSIGTWLGRQAEETIGRKVNEQLVGVLHDQWQREKSDRSGEYVDIADAKTSVLKDTWNSIPRDTQRLLMRTFDGPVMVRKDMLDNALGYRAASIADVFTGMSDLPTSVQKNIADAAYGLLGKNAYQHLVFAERAIQGVVGMAKETIVVKSGIVALANATSNQYQLVMHGVNPLRLVQTQAAKVREVETYLRQEKRLAQITLELASATRPDVRSKLQREQQVLQDANSRLSIWPLLQAGELPSIAEGLSEHDQYTLLNDFTGWLASKTKGLPPGLITAAKYATIAKDTALHQGLNRAVQFGDFMAKAALYDHLISKGKTQAEALAYVNDRFVNYNLMAGRTRDYHESMGMTWFWNYKIRIQKVILATIRDNPLRFLASGITAETFMHGTNTLMSDNALNTNWQYSIGPGQLLHSRQMLMWDQLLGR
ncbi:diguanylate cyclase [Dyella sp. ASV21]|uniref:GGDEF domain-containing protein n=1 Tax=Dyella sp. ASV21 TaxID=2795114 RepID=UPI0018ED0CCF|nr:diguanylate cyclase [Dyella sp. ASV21]